MLSIPTFRMTPVEMSFVDKAPDGIRASAIIDAAPDRVFAMLADVTTWPRWFEGNLGMRWLTPNDGLGAVRRATLLIGHFDERMIAWEPARRFAFSIDAATLPLARRCMEDWRLTAIDGGKRTLVEWALLVDARLLVRLFRPLLVIVFTTMFRRSASRLNEVLLAMDPSTAVSQVSAGS